MQRIKIDNLLFQSVENFNTNIFANRKSNFVIPLEKIEELKFKLLSEGKTLLATYICEIEKNYFKLLNCKPSDFDKWKIHFNKIFNFENLPDFTSTDIKIVENIQMLCKRYNCTEDDLKSFADSIIIALRYKDYREKEYPSIVDKLGWNLKTCFYCNYTGTLTVKKGAKYKAYYDLDHVLPKSIYPFLATSFFNFIPSCASCNRTKGSQIIYGLNPFYEDSEIDVESKKIFSISSASKTSFYTSNNKEDIKICVADTINNISVKEYSKIVDLESLYSLQKHIAEEILWKKRIYTKNYINHIRKSFSLKGANMNKINRVLWGTGLDQERINDEPLAKLKYDLIRNDK